MEQTSNYIATIPHTLPSPVDFNSYVRAVNEIPMLSMEREQALVASWRNENNREAARELVLAHLRLVTKVVKDHRGYGLPEGDLAQEGTVGLMRAVKGFDPAHGVRLASYAVKWIEAEIREFIFKSWRLVRLGGGATMKKLFFGYRKTMEALQGWSADRPVGVHHEDVAKALNVPVEDAAIAMRYFSGADLSLDMPSDEETPARQDHLLGLVSSSQDNDDPSFLVESENDAKAGMAAISVAWEGLDERSQSILRDRRLTDPAVPLREVAQKWSISIERARQLEQSSWAKWVSAAQSILHTKQLS